ncbi:hypothetical protein BHM03_00038715 [Ensete ventricosum]|uniref:Uncharacterized protein n=1 Tax=Ensete ventricosum TaxID=4639 RepID=A0A445MJW6_ENSVE|nr:hypothetical protein BHM03_00038715 [Ensete ventricosum]
MPVRIWVAITGVIMTTPIADQDPSTLNSTRSRTCPSVAVSLGSTCGTKQRTHTKRKRVSMTGRKRKVLFKVFNAV